HWARGGDEVRGDRILRRLRLLGEGGDGEEEQEPFHRETPVEGMRRRKSVGGCHVAMARAAARSLGVKEGLRRGWTEAMTMTMSMNARAAAGRRHAGRRDAGATTRKRGIVRDSSSRSSAKRACRSSVMISPAA